MIKEEKYEESYEKKFDTESVREMNDYSMILVTDPGELVEMGSVYEEFSARDGPQILKKVGGDLDVQFKELMTPE